MKIETQRLIIRPFIESDCEDLYEYLSSKDTLKFEPFKPLSKEECIEETLYRSQNPSFLAVCLKDSNKLIGNLYFKENDFSTWELGYIFNSKYHHNGYATESVYALMYHAFNVLSVRRIIAMCDPKNTSSWKLLERVKMKREGHLIQNIYFFKDDNGCPIWKDTYEYGILKEQWIDRRA